jgi:hypothetical protein
MRLLPVYNSLEVNNLKAFMCSCRKKFFLAPSLCTKAGEKQAVNVDW